MFRWFCFMLVAAALLAGGCGQKSESPTQTSSSSVSSTTNQRTFQVRGVVREVFPESKTIKIKHEEIPNYMPAMTMPFEVKDVKELAGLNPGDTVEFRMIVTEKEGWIDQIRKTNAAAILTIAPETNPPARSAVRVVRDVQQLNAGDPLPNYTFTNELGQAMSIEQLRGKALAITFIFTRCPFPEFCPRMSNNFKEAYDKLTAMANGPTNWHLLTISFDVEFDTPAVLRGYAKQYNPDPAHWSFLTGALIDIDAITEHFGLIFPRNDQGGFDHNMRTAVIDARGKVQEILAGNKWTSDELVQQIVKAAKAGAEAQGSKTQSSTEAQASGAE